MQLGSLIALAVGLSMDAAAVAASRGLSAPVLHLRHFVIVGLTFGGLQALMPLGGFLLGVQFGPLLAAWDHWIAFGLLVGLGAKMIYESWTRDPHDHPTDDATVSTADPFGARVMVVLGIATSLDAFAVGFTLPMLGARLAASLAIIGITTAVLSTVALALGRRLGEQFGPRLDVFGGVLLIVIGCKILAEHLGYLG